jgi:D-aspartate ligase
MVDRQHEQPVFILGGRFPALGVIHSLAHKGVVCWVCESRRLQATWSRYARYAYLPDPVNDERRMIDGVLELARKVGGKPVLIPTADHYARALARHRAELEIRTAPCVASSGTVELLLDKQRFYNWGRKKKLSCPRAESATVPQPSLSMPLVAKPVNFKDFASKAPRMGRRELRLRFTLIKSERELNDFRMRHRDRLDQFILQEYIAGTSADMYSIGVYANHNSDIIGLFTGRKVRGYPALYGNTILGQNDVVSDTVIDEITRIVQELRYTGIAEFEYKRDVTTGEFRLIEINPRCWSWIGATEMSVANIPWIAYSHLAGLSVDPAFHNTEPGSIKAVRVMSDLANVFWRYRRDYPAWIMSPRAWRMSLEARNLMLIEFHRADWPVSLYCLALLLRDLLKHE